MTLLLLSLFSVLAGFVHGLAGFGSILVAVPLFTLLLPPQQAVPLSTILALAINAYLAQDMRAKVHWKDILLPLSAALPGVIVGITALRALPAAAILAVLGLVLILFATSQLAGLRACEVSSRLRRAWLLGAGFLSGCLGGAVATHGPPIIVTYTCQPWPKERLKATLTTYLLASGSVIATAQIASGLLTGHTLVQLLSIMPGLAVGVLLGRAAFKRLGERGYRRAICIVLLILGAGLLVRASTA